MNKEYNTNLVGIIESTEDAIIIKSLDGTIQSWNKGSEKMFGYTSKEMIGKNISLIIPPEFINDFNNNLSRISNNEIVDRYETTRIKKNGEQLYVSLIGSDIKDSAGNITGFYQVTRDITSQKKNEAKLIEAYKELAFQNQEKDKRAAELITANKELAFQNAEKEKRANELEIVNEELAFQNHEKEKRAAELLIAYKELDFLHVEKHALFASIVNSSDDAMLSKTIDGIITSWNYGAEKIFGYSANEIIGKNVLTLIPPELQQEEVGIIEKIQNGETINQYETIRVKKDGTTFHASLTISPIRNFEGNIIGASKVLRDITERKNTERRIKDNEKGFKSLIENSSDGIILTDEFFNVIYSSPGSQKITGNLPTENIFRLTHPDDLNPLKNIHAQVLSNPDIPASFHGRFLNESGKYIWLEGAFTNMLHVYEVNAIVANYRDITNRKKLEDLLHKANVLARLGSWEVDLLKETVYWSDITREIHEAESSFVPDLATGINFYKEGPSRDLITQKVKEAIELGKPWDEELQIVTVKNNVRWIRTIGETEFVDGKCVKIMGSFQDIDERKNAEEKIIESENRMRLVTSSAAMGIWYWDIKNDKMVWDEKLYQIYDIDNLQLGSVYEGWLSRLHPEDKDRVNEVMQTAIADKKREYSSEFRIIWGDLSVHYIKGTGITEYDDNGNVIRMMGVNWDVTAEKEKERHLKLLESVITNTTDSVLITEAEPFDEPGPRILYVNEAFTKMTGYSSEEVIGKTPRILQGSKSDKAELKRLSEAIRRWESCEITTINYKKNGEEFWINFTLTPVANERGWYTHWIAIERDVTELKKYISAIENQNTKLREIAWAQSHIVREPLTRMMGIVSALSDIKSDSSEYNEWVAHFNNSASELDNIIKDIVGKAQAILLN